MHFVKMGFLRHPIETREDHGRIRSRQRAADRTANVEGKFHWGGRDGLGVKSGGWEQSRSRCMCREGKTRGWKEEKVVQEKKKYVNGKKRVNGRRGGSHEIGWRRT